MTDMVSLKDETHSTEGEWCNFCAFSTHMGDPTTDLPAAEPWTTLARWRKPRHVFVSDLFHKDVPDEFIARVFAVMAATPQHSYRILTKYPDRMHAILSDPEWEFQGMVGEWRHRHGETNTTIPTPDDPSWGWPLPNVRLGVPAEDQKVAP